MTIKQIAHFRSFKSFRLKKKSSTLGINKTSESPPMLRRDDDAYNCNNTTVDVQVRHTIDVGLANNFARGAAYRSSLQDLNSRVRLFLQDNLECRTVNKSLLCRTNKFSSFETIAIVIRCKVEISHRNLNCERQHQLCRQDIFDRLCLEVHRRRVSTAQIHLKMIMFIQLAKRKVLMACR